MDAAGRDGEEPIHLTPTQQRLAGSDWNGGRHHRAQAHLTNAERLVVRAVADRLTNRQVATRLGVSERTVESHLLNVFRKLSITSRSELLDWLESNGGVQAIALANGPASPLSPRELEVAWLIADRLTDKEVAIRLGIKPNTARHHVAAVRRKLGCAFRNQVGPRLEKLYCAAHGTPAPGVGSHEA